MSKQVHRKVPIQIPAYAVLYGQMQIHKQVGLPVQTYLPAYRYRYVFRYIESLLHRCVNSYPSISVQSDLLICRTT